MCRGSCIPVVDHTLSTGESHYKTFRSVRHDERHVLPNSAALGMVEGLIGAWFCAINLDACQSGRLDFTANEGYVSRGPTVRILRPQPLCMLDMTHRYV